MTVPSPAENAATVRAGLSRRKFSPLGEEVVNTEYPKEEAALAALLAQAEAGALAEGREGMVTAYDHEGRYVGCIGSETWRWLIDHPEVDAPALIRAHEMFSERAFDQQKARAEAAEEWLGNETRRRQAAEADRDAAVRERDGWKQLALDMGEALRDYESRWAVLPPEWRALLARLDGLAAGKETAE